MRPVLDSSGIGLFASEYLVFAEKIRGEQRMSEKNREVWRWRFLH